MQSFWNYLRYHKFPKRESKQNTWSLFKPLIPKEKAVTIRAIVLKHWCSKQGRTQRVSSGSHSCPFHKFFELVIVLSSADTRSYLNKMQGDNHWLPPFEFLGTSPLQSIVSDKCLSILWVKLEGPTTKQIKPNLNIKVYLNLSCPAVSHICSLTDFPATLTILEPNSTPIVWWESCLTVIWWTNISRTFVNNRFVI